MKRRAITLTIMESDLLNLFAGNCESSHRPNGREPGISLAEQVALNVIDHMGETMKLIGAFLRDSGTCGEEAADLLWYTHHQAAAAGQIVFAIARAEAEQATGTSDAEAAE